MAETMRTGYTYRCLDYRTGRIVSAYRQKKWRHVAEDDGRKELFTSTEFRQRFLIVESPFDAIRAAHPHPNGERHDTD